MLPPLPRRRWFRFGLRTLLVFTLLVGLLMGWIVRERRQSAREMEIAETLKSQGWRVWTAGRFCSPESWWLEETVWWRRFALQVLGVRIVGLEAEGDSICDLSLLKDLSMLRYMSLSSCKHVRDISPLADVTTLTELYLGYTGVEDLSPLANLTMLEDLELRSTSVDDFSPLTELVQLKRLDLSFTRICDAKPLASLRNLEGLDLNGVLELRDLTILTKLTRLRQLDLQNTNVSRESVDRLLSKLPNCEIRHDFSD